MIPWSWQCCTAGQAGDKSDRLARRLRSAGEARRERSSVGVFHRKERLLLVIADFKDGGHLRMLHTSSGAGFFGEARGERFFRIPRQHFEATVRPSLMCRAR